MLGGLATVLKNTLDPTHQVRLDAECFLLAAEQNNLVQFIDLLGKEFSSEENDTFVRQAAAIRLKNCFYTNVNNLASRRAMQEKWLNLPDEIRSKIGDSIRLNITNPNPVVASTAAQLTSVIGRIEIFAGNWENFVVEIYNHIVKGDVGDHGIAAMIMCLGYLCDECIRNPPEPSENKSMKPINFESIWSGLLNIMFLGLSFPSLEIKLASGRALFYGLEINAAYSDMKQSDLDTLFNSITQLARSENDELRMAGLLCIVQLAAKVYDLLGPYIEQIARITWDAMQSSDERIACAGIEFWNTVAEEELDIASSEWGSDLLQSHDLIRKAMPHFFGILLERLVNNEQEEIELDSWSISTAAGTCIALIAQILKDEIVEPVLVFVKTNIESCDVKKRTAAVLAFGSILEGPSYAKLDPFSMDLLMILSNFLADQSISLRYTASWGISRMATFHPELLIRFIEKHQGLGKGVFVKFLIQRLDDHPRVAANICMIINEISEYYRRLQNEIPKDAPAAPTIFDIYFEELCKALLQKGEPEDPGNKSLREAAYICMATLIGGVGADCIPIMIKLLEHQNMCLKNMLSDKLDDNQKDQINLTCGTIQVLVQRLDASALPYASLIWTNLSHIMHHEISEDVLLATSALISLLKNNFEVCMQSFLPILLRILREEKDPKILKLTIEIIGDISRALSKQFTLYTEEITPILCNLMANPEVDRSIKPAGILALSDIAMATKDKFIPHLNMYVTLIVQAGDVESLNTCDYEWSEYINSLRMAVLQSYSAIIYAMKDCDHLHALSPQLEKLWNYLEALTSRSDMTITVYDGIVSLALDLVIVFGKTMAEYIKSKHFDYKLSEALKNSKTETPNIRNEVISKMTNLTQIINKLIAS